MLEQRCIKFIWILLHSPNIIVKSVMRSAIRNGYSTLGEHFRYLNYKYDLSPTLWISPLCNVYKCINDYVIDFIERTMYFQRLWRFFCSKYRNVSIVRRYLYNIIIMLL